jgi:dipeptidyl aminopeptidase/acylaminoacyl peptidase
VFVRNTANRPAELYKTAVKPGSVTTQTADPIALTHHNDRLLAELDLAPAEGFTFKGAGGDDVSGWLIKPPGFDAKKRYPVVFLIHGGPQGAWHDEWHNRWNYALFAAPGYAVVAVNPRGSTGYGQKFTDQISRDWTGRVYDDLMKGLDHALKTYPFLDSTRVAAAGGSYGGFMVNWIAGHTDRFQALISHAGVFDLTSKYGTTEELWFPEWEFGGPPWEQPEHYRERSPSEYAAHFKTPTLVLHGALDFRVPDAQGLGMFTALRRRGVPSRYVFFPDEGHWIAKPANRVDWWREVHARLDRYLKSGGS